FKGTDIHLPPGVTSAPVTGTLTNGQTFSSSVKIFNRDPSFYAPAAVSQAQNRQAANPGRLAIPVTRLQRQVELKGDLPGVAANPISIPSAIQIPSTPVPA